MYAASTVYQGYTFNETGPHKKAKKGFMIHVTDANNNTVFVLREPGGRNSGDPQARAWVDRKMAQNRAAAASGGASGTPGIPSPPAAPGAPGVPGATGSGPAAPDSGGGSSPFGADLSAYVDVDDAETALGESKYNKYGYGIRH